MVTNNVSILAVDRAYQPDKWLDGPAVVNLFARGLVQNTFGDIALRLRGGINAKTGLQSTMEIGSIVVVNTKNHLVTDFDYAPFRRESLFVRDRFMCAYCGQVFKASQLEVEHIVPQCQNGPTSWLNCVSSCSSCNRVKSGNTPEQANMPLLYLPYRPSRFEWLILENRRILADQMSFLQNRLPRHSRLL